MSIVESQKSYEPRILSFYGLLGLMLLLLVAGLGYRQLVRSDAYAEAEKMQNQRRVLIPGPRALPRSRLGARRARRGRAGCRAFSCAAIRCLGL